MSPIELMPPHYYRVLALPELLKPLQGVCCKYLSSGSVCSRRGEVVDRRLQFLDGGESIPGHSRPSCLSDLKFLTQGDRCYQWIGFVYCQSQKNRPQTPIAHKTALIG